DRTSESRNKRSRHDAHNFGQFERAQFPKDFLAATFPLVLKILEELLAKLIASTTTAAPRLLATGQEIPCLRVSIQIHNLTPLIQCRAFQPRRPPRLVDHRGPQPAPAKTRAPLRARGGG